MFISFALAFFFAVLPPWYVSVPGHDAPELAPRGAYHVGVRTVEMVRKAQPDLLHVDKQTGQAPVYDRPLKLEIWYPAVIPPGQEEETTYELPTPSGRPFLGMNSFPIRDKALRDAPPVPGKRFPLVIVSHGHMGHRYFMTWLDANLASKGYVVVAIDHTDSTYWAPSSFESTLVNRPGDQIDAVHTITDWERQPSHFLHGLVDATNAAVVGYSMGGYGALTTAGAGMNPDSSLMKWVPGGYLKRWAENSPEYKAVDRSQIKAAVAIAPWGAQPPRDGWIETGLAGIRIPMLFIGGDHDDVSDYAKGIRPAFEHAVHSERCLLTYDNANHNVGAIGPPPGIPLDFDLMHAFEEPVWRKDYLLAINTHFITAFLDLYLKGDESKRAYLHVEPEKSNEGKWVGKPGEHLDGGFSSGQDAQGNAYWKGFRNRWALGMEMSCKSASQ